MEEDYQVFIAALQDMQNEGLNIVVLSQYVTKHTGIYSIDSFAIHNYTPRRFKDEKQSF